MRFVRIYILFCSGSYDTVDQITEFYTNLLKMKNISKVDRFYLVDGGCDVLLKGTETNLATYVEDMMHLKTIKNLMENNDLFINCSFNVCALGLNVECGHGVKENELIERLKEMEENNIMIKKELLDLSQDKTKFYYDTMLKCNPGHSLVQSFVLCALDGKTGFIVPEYENVRIGRNRYVNVSDLTKTYVMCDGIRLANSIVYLHRITNEMTSEEVSSFY